MAKVFKSIIGPSKNGMLVSCADGIRRRIFPYIQDLSADMEEMFVNIFDYKLPIYTLFSVIYSHEHMDQKPVNHALVALYQRIQSPLLTFIFLPILFWK